MTRKIRGWIAGTIAAVLLGMTVLPDAVTVADAAGIIAAEEATETGQEEQSGVAGETGGQLQETEEPARQEEQPEEVPVTRNRINYVGIESPYLQTPGEQQIVVSFGDGSEEITDIKLICQTPDGTEIELELSGQEEELYLFRKTFEENEAGVYHLLRFQYTKNGVESVVELSETGIDAMFGVDECYPGYEDGIDFDAIDADASAEEIADTIEMSVVNVETDQIEQAQTDIEDAINTTVEDMESTGQKEGRTEEDGSYLSKTMGVLFSSLADAIMPAVIADAAEPVVVVLDPGHGGTDGGATANGLIEKNLNLKIAQYCKEELEQYGGVTVYMTRTEDKALGNTTSEDLANRVKMAKEWGADVFVSIHINSSTASSAKGSEVWYPNSNYNSAIHKEGEALSTAILEQLKSLGLTSRGIKTRNSENGTTYADGSMADYYSVIRDSKVNGFPGIIVEHAFITNASDAAKLSDESFLKKLGIADATGIANYFGLTKETVPSSPSIKVSGKSDYNGTATINVSGLGSNATVKVWNEGTGASKTYSAASGRSTLAFQISDFGNARGTYYIEAFSASGTSLGKTSFHVSTDTGCTISVKPDTTGQQWTVNIKFADMPSEVTKVQVPVWCSSDQSDIIWYNAKQTSAGNWQATVKFSDYKKYGTYQVHAYAGLTDGSLKFIGKTTIEAAKPTLTVSTSNYNQKEGTFDVIIRDVVSPAGVKQIQVPVWCDSDQNDIVWYNAVRQSDGSYKVTVNAANHKYHTGAYKIHTYLTDGNGFRLFTGSAPSINVTLPETVVSASDPKGTETEYTLKATNVRVSGTIKAVQFATWSSANGQDDIIWYNGTKSSNGDWTATVNIKNHKSTGTYNVHVYAALSNGKLQFIGATTFNVTNPTLSVSTTNYQEKAGTFDVIIKNVVSPSGVSKIQVPVWCASNQSDIVWYNAARQSDGSYKVTVSMANHKYAVGDYKIHTYITTGNGKMVFGGAAPNVKVIMPNMEVTATDTKGTETEYTLKVTNPSLIGVIKGVQFATWSSVNGQDDIIWYSGKKDASGNWTATANVKNHKTSTGVYNVHVYATMSTGTLRFLGSTTFTVSVPSISGVGTRNYDDTTGKFTVVVSGAAPAKGISKIQVPVWCASDQSDIVWYNAEKQSDGTYTVQVDPVNHKNSSGLYKIHVYATTANGLFQYVGKTSQMVGIPKYYSIMGETTVTVKQMVAYYESAGKEYPALELGAGGAGTLQKFCEIYCEEAAAEGVRAEVAFTQAMRETGWLQYGGIVKIEQFNFAGIGAIDGNTAGNCANFPDVRTGIRAHIQHLKAYACEDALNQECVDPRFNLVTRGCAPYVEWLGQQENPTGKGWASAEGYGESIAKMIQTLKEK